VLVLPLTTSVMPCMERGIGRISLQEGTVFKEERLRKCELFTFDDTSFNSTTAKNTLCSSLESVTVFLPTEGSSIDSDHSYRCIADYRMILWLNKRRGFDK
jgi:hypothetical protein